MKDKKDYKFIIGNKTRREILNLIENKSLNASQIKEALKISSYGLLYQHLKVLEGAKLITKKQIKDENGKKKQGRETIISINKEDNKHCFTIPIERAKAVIQKNAFAECSDCRKTTEETEYWYFIEGDVGVDYVQFCDKCFKRRCENDKG